MCPDKKGKSKAPVKAQIAETEEESDNDNITEPDNNQPMTLDQYIKLGKTLKEEDKITLIRRAVIAQDEEGGKEEDF